MNHLKLDRVIENLNVFYFTSIRLKILRALIRLLKLQSLLLLLVVDSLVVSSLVLLAKEVSF